LVLKLGSIKPLGFDGAISGVHRRSREVCNPFSLCYIGQKWGLTKVLKTM